MPFRCDTYTHAWTFESIETPVRRYAVLFQQVTGKRSWKVSVNDTTGKEPKEIAQIMSIQEPTQERAELVLRCYVDNDRDLEAFIQRGHEN